MAELIKMQSVLAEINEYVGDEDVKWFSIKYRKTDGTVGYKSRVRKAGQSKRPEGKAAGQSKSMYHLKEKGVLHLQEPNAKSPFAVKISLITHFNEQRVWH